MYVQSIDHHSSVGELDGMRARLNALDGLLRVPRLCCTSIAVCCCFVVCKANHIIVADSAPCGALFAVDRTTLTAWKQRLTTLLEQPKASSAQLSTEDQLRVGRAAAIISVMDTPQSGDQRQTDLCQALDSVNSALASATGGAATVSQVCIHPTLC